MIPTCRRSDYQCSAAQDTNTPQPEGWGLALSVDPLADAIAWKRANPEAYRALVLWAKEDIANGVHPSMDAYEHLLRRPHMAARLGLTRLTGDPVLFNDHLTSPLARLLRREHDIPFSTRQARVDSWRTPSCS